MEVNNNVYTPCFEWNMSSTNELKKLVYEFHPNDKKNVLQTINPYNGYGSFLINAQDYETYSTATADNNSYNFITDYSYVGWG